MKLWEAVSAFRNATDALDAVFGSDKWRPVYFEAYSHFDELVRKQDRTTLDALLPLELTREIAARYHTVNFRFYPKDRALRVANPQCVTADEFLELTALEVHDRFGGSVIEEVFEYGSAYVTDNQ